MKREREEAEAWWRAVLANPEPAGREAPKGFALRTKDGTALNPAKKLP